MSGQTVHSDGSRLPDYYADGTGPIPPVLTAIEVAKLLRLDTVSRCGGEVERAPEDSIKSVDHLVRLGKLHPLGVGRSNRFARDEVLALVNRNGQEVKQ